MSGILNRRRFLLGSVVTATALVGTRRIGTVKGEQILVIGAGIAGLGAALRLQELGYRVIVLVALAPNDRDNNALYDASGMRISNDDASALDDAFTDLFNGARDAADATGDDLSVNDGLNRALTGTLLGLNQQQGVDWERAEIEIVTGVPLAALSLKAYVADNVFDGGDALFPDGYDAIVRELAKGTDVRTGQVVSRVEYGQGGVRVFTNRGEFTADRALITVPLGVLKARRISCAPAIAGTENTGHPAAWRGRGGQSRVALQPRFLGRRRGLPQLHCPDAR